MSGLASELYRRLREKWIEDIEAFLRRIDPGLLNGTLTPAGLPPNTMINRGGYTVTTRYRPGDLVIAGGVAYVAIRSSTGVSVSDTDYWQRLGGGGGVGPPPDTFVYLTDDTGEYLTDEDGAYLWEAA